jgi:hypothetical protein
MKRKDIISTIFAVLALGVLLTLVGCDSHSHEWEITTVAPTCAECGYDRITCASCGEARSDNYTDPTGLHLAGESGFCRHCGAAVTTTRGVEITTSDDGTYATVTGYSGTHTRVNIGATHGGVPITRISVGAFKKCEALTEVIASENLAYIDDEAFYRCTSLTSVTVGGRLEYVGKNAFDGCTSLSSFGAPRGVREIADRAFLDCASLSDVMLLADAVSVGEEAFRNCIAISSAMIPDSLTYLGKGAFSGARGITAVNIGGGLDRIRNNTFAGCSSLTDLMIGAGVTVISDEAFIECVSLTAVDIPDGVTEIGRYAFAACKSLTTFNIGRGLTYLPSDAVSYCTSLTEFTVDGDNARYSSIGGDLYSADGTVLLCYAAGKSDAEFCVPESVIRIRPYAFSHCENLRRLYVHGRVEAVELFAVDRCPSLTVCCEAESLPGGWAENWCDGSEIVWGYTFDN